MFPFFHIAVPLIVLEIPYIKSRFSFNRFTIIIASIFPDIIDKPLLFLSLGTGRGISHTLIFLLSSTLILYLISKRNIIMTLSFLYGISFHFILDLPEVPLFYPLVYYDSNLFWNEQYLLQALLTYNTKLEVVWAGTYLFEKYPDEMQSTFSPEYELMRETYPLAVPSSFWLRVK